MRTVRLGWIAWVVALGCTPLPDAPRARRDASVDVATDQGPADGVVDAALPDGVAVDVPMMIDGPVDATFDASVDVTSPSDGGLTLTGTFVSTAIPSSNTRLSGGFVWQGPVNSTRLEGWLR